MAGEYVTLYRVTRANGKSRVGSKQSMSMQVAKWKVEKASHERHTAQAMAKGWPVWAFPASLEIVKVEAITINPDEWMDITKEALSNE